MIRINNTFSTTQEGWRARAAHLKALRDEYNQNWTIMTPYEQQKALQAISEAHEAHELAIRSGALQEWNAAVDALKQTLRDVDTARAREIVRWNVGKLQSEMALASSLVDGAIQSGDLGRLDEIYAEAQQSGDEYKKRAAAEIMRGVLGKVPPGNLETRMKANRIKERAEQDLQALRGTPELDNARAVAGLAVEGISKARDTLYEAAATLGKIAPNETLQDDAFINALQRVETDERGNITKVK